MGTKIFVNFTRYDYEECIRRLNNEIMSLIKSTQKQLSTKNNTVNKTEKQEADDLKIEINSLLPVVDRNDGICEWTSEQVGEWLKLSVIHPVILGHLHQCNGQFLYEMFEMKIKAPDYFFSLIGGQLQKSQQDNDKFELRHILSFSNQLDELFLI